MLLLGLFARVKKRKGIGGFFLGVGFDNAVVKIDFGGSTIVE